MRVALLTREYPPEVYGGAGVHVEYLARELARLEDVTVHCWGADRPGADPPAVGYRAWDALDGKAPHLAALQAVSIDLAMAAGVEGAELVHSHTWYANLAGHLAKLIYDIPHVATVHSLEPLRPWKAEQLGGGYALSSFCERTALEAADAIVAVSEGMRRDVLACYPALDPARVEVIHNGIDAAEYRPDPGDGRARAARRRPGRAVGRLRRAGSRARRGSRTCSRRRSSSIPARSSCSARARRTRPRSAPRSSGSSSACARRAATCSGSPRCCRSAT